MCVLIYLIFLSAAYTFEKIQNPNSGVYIQDPT